MIPSFRCNVRYADLFKKDREVPVPKLQVGDRVSTRYGDGVLVRVKQDGCVSVKADNGTTYGLYLKDIEGKEQ